MSSLTIDQILAAQDRSVEEVPTPEWGGSVFVRRLSAGEFLDYGAALNDLAGGKDSDIARERLAISLATFLCDAHGKQIFTLDQARGLAGKAAKPVMRIVAVGDSLNSVGKKDVEGLSKNSAPSLDATSSTG